MKKATLIGEKTESYNILQLTEERSHQGCYVYECECLSCKQRINLSTKQLKKGKKCECQKTTLIGKTIGDYKVLYPTEARIHGFVVYECKCLYCGKISKLSSEQIRNKKKCECQKTTLAGRTIGNYKVLHSTKEKIRGCEFYECECLFCGEIVKLTSGQIRNKKKCECQKITLIGKTIGNYKILYPTEARIRDSVVYGCECLNCGKIAKLSSTQIIQGKKCECQSKSALLKDEMRGNYQILRVTEERLRGHLVCECKCLSCGRKLNLSTEQFKNEKKCECQKTTLVGKTIGDYKILYPTKERNRSSVVYGCECLNCGKILKIAASQVKCKICECQKKSGIGKTINNYEILSRMKRNNLTICEGKCIFCGKREMLTSVQLAKKKCVCQKNLLTGQVIGNYKVQKLMKERIRRSLVYECECTSCGRLDNLTAQQIKRQKKCECNFLTGRTIGTYKVLKPTGKKMRGHLVFECNCTICGRKEELSTEQLQFGKKCECQYVFKSDS